jgi:hypothetical protein
MMEMVRETAAGTMTRRFRRGRKREEDCIINNQFIWREQ